MIVFIGIREEKKITIESVQLWHPRCDKTVLSMYQLPPTGGHSSSILPCNNAFVSLSYSLNLSRPLPFLAPKEAVLAQLCHLEAGGGKGVHRESVKGG